MGKFDHRRWSERYAEMFRNFALVHNNRQMIKIEMSAEGDGAFAVVDIDTLWKNIRSGEEMQWKGRTGKTFVKTDQGWKMIAQTGVLEY